MLERRCAGVAVAVVQDSPTISITQDLYIFSYVASFTYNAKQSPGPLPCLCIPTICSLCIVLFHQDSAMESHRLDTCYGGSHAMAINILISLGKKGGSGSGEL